MTLSVLEQEWNIQRRWRWWNLWAQGYGGQPVIATDEEEPVQDDEGALEDTGIDDGDAEGGGPGDGYGSDSADDADCENDDDGCAGLGADAGAGTGDVPEPKV